MNDTASGLTSAIQTSRRHQLAIHKDWSVLIVSAHLQNRKELLRILEGLPLNVFIAGTILQAQEVLACAAIEVIFCEESLPDGSYCHILQPLVEKLSTTRFVVTLFTGEWDEYLQAMRLGANDILRCPLQAIEVHRVLIRAGREQNREVFDVTA